MQVMSTVNLSLLIDNILNFMNDLIDSRLSILARIQISQQGSSELF